MTYYTSNKFRPLIRYSLITVLCGLFSFTYEHFSHDVYSNFMVYLFMIPLLLGVVPATLELLLPKFARSSTWQRTIRAFAVATLIAGSALQGVLNIYGTTSPFVIYYLWVGIGLLLLSGLLRLIPHYMLRHRHLNGRIYS